MVTATATDDDDIQGKAYDATLMRRNWQFVAPHKRWLLAAGVDLPSTGWTMTLIEGTSILLPGSDGAHRTLACLFWGGQSITTRLNALRPRQQGRAR